MNISHLSRSLRCRASVEHLRKDTHAGYARRPTARTIGCSQNYFLARGSRRGSPGSAAGTSAWAQSRLESSDWAPGRRDEAHRLVWAGPAVQPRRALPRGFLMPQLCGRRPVVIGPREQVSPRRGVDVAVVGGNLVRVSMPTYKNCTDNSKDNGSGALDSQR